MNTMEFLQGACERIAGVLKSDPFCVFNEIVQIEAKSDDISANNGKYEERHQSKHSKRLFLVEGK